MQATITYLLTEQAQRAQMTATGQPVARKQVATVEVSAEDLELFPVSESGEIKVELDRGYETDLMVKLKAGGMDGRQNHSSLYAYTPDQINNIAATLRVGLVKLAENQERDKALLAENGRKNRERTEAAYRAFLADPTARIKSARDVVEAVSPAAWWPENHAEFVAEIARRNKADRDAEDVAKAAKEAAKQSYIAAWVAANGDELTRAQFDDGLLCRETLISMIADAAFTAAGVGATYRYTICDNMRCPCGKEKLACIPPSDYAKWSVIKAKLPESATVEFLGITPCPGDEGYESEDNPEAVICAKITIPHGPFSFTRTIEL